MSHTVSSTVVSSLKFLRLHQLTYRSADGVERTWESVERTTKISGRVDGVDILAVMRSPDSESGSSVPQLILVKQFRPPVSGYCIEFPAGLTDSGEDPAATATRELREETGYATAAVNTVSPPLVLEPGLTNASTAVVMLEAHFNSAPAPQLEDDEFIDIILVPVVPGHMVAALSALGLSSSPPSSSTEHPPPATYVDAKVWTFAAGVDLGASLTK